MRHKPAFVIWIIGLILAIIGASILFVGFANWLFYSFNPYEIAFGLAFMFSGSLVMLSVEKTFPRRGR